MFGVGTLFRVDLNGKQKDNDPFWPDLGTPLMSPTGTDACSEYLFWGKAM